MLDPYIARMKLFNNCLWIIRYFSMLITGKCLEHTPPNAHNPQYTAFTKSLEEKISAIKKHIDDPAVKVVSFDIFDTLLYRPCLYPTDLFYLIANKVNPTYHIDFISLRLRAEFWLHKPYASLDDIYGYIEKHAHIDHSVIQQLMQEEMACEKQVLAARQDIKNLYEYALSKSKRIIAVSDMYLPSYFLRDVLQQNGYKHIAKVYVSTECKAVKYDGTLFDKVLKEEHIAPQEIMHIGDNKKSDFIAPTKLHIRAFYYPSVKDVIFHRANYKILWRLFPRLSPDPVTRMLLAFGLFRAFQDSTQAPQEPYLVQNMKQFTDVAFGPVLFFIAHYMATSKDIQTNYRRIHFAARDGFLPKMAYDLLRERWPHLLPSNYLYASRRAYFPLFFNSFEEFVRKSIDTNTFDCLTWKEFLKCTIIDPELFVAVCKKIPPSVLQLSIKDNLDICLKSLRVVNEELQNYLDNLRTNALAYYGKQFENSIGKEVVFDLGYGGSISRALNNITNLRVDKIYLWQSSKNKRWDKKQHTHTFCPTNFLTLFRLGVHLIYEELFSPLQGSCIGFDKQAKPLLENLSFSSQTKDTFSEVHKASEQFIKDICDRFGDYLPYLICQDTTSLHTLMLYLIGASPFKEISIFEPVQFPDPLTCGVTINLKDKLLLLRKRTIIGRIWAYLVSRFSS